MFRFLCVLMSLLVSFSLMCFLFTNTTGEIVDKKIILKVQHGIEKTIQYIDKLYNRVNEDCLLGVAISTAIMADAYRNGTHFMDFSTLEIIDKLTYVLKKSLPYVHDDRRWIADNMLIPYMWRQDIKYKYNNFKVSRIENYTVINKLGNFFNDPLFTNVDFCFEDLINNSSLLLSKKCLVNEKCLDIYNEDDDSSFGYLTTHKLLLLQVAKHRNCIMDKNIYERNVKHLCSQIYSDVFHEDYYDELDAMFDLFVEQAIMADAYRNGTHIMDSSTLKIVDKLTDVLKKSIPYVHADRQWIVDNMLIPYMWRQEIKYKYNDFKVARIKNYSVMNKIRNYHNDPFFTNLDFCFEDLLNISSLLLSKKCLVNGKCLDIYNRDDDSSFGYITTHKLLLLQVAKHRNCLMDSNIYERNVKRLCSQIYSDVFHEEYYDELDGLFDLFVEQVALCGYEGYTDFLSNKWLLYILKSQRSTGCFVGNLTDDLKTKIKRTSNIFEDGCADHTTGIALSVLSLYYNFIVKEIFV